MSGSYVGEREFLIDNLLVRIQFIIAMIRWTGLAPWELKKGRTVRCGFVGRQGGLKGRAPARTLRTKSLLVSNPVKDDRSDFTPRQPVSLAVSSLSLSFLVSPSGCQPFKLFQSTTHILRLSARLPRALSLSLSFSLSLRG